jgi:multidrug efflux pump subunit AcrA (membrane-fusion protein)
VYELRARWNGTVIEVEVDEGQLVAEDDPIAIVDVEGSCATFVTDVPGVVRELYVERGRRVVEGQTVALIDES